MPSKEETTRCGFVAIIGAPNAGKSTLINRLVGSKVSIVTHKVQTTRSQIRAIALIGRTQIVFVDTPGIFTPKRTLDRLMVEAAWGVAREADMAVLITDARKTLGEEALAVIKGLEVSGVSAVLALYKTSPSRRHS
jgi:GTP-binding protein Era